MQSRSETYPSRKTRQQLRQSDVRQARTKNKTDVSSVTNTIACWKSWRHPPGPMMSHSCSLPSNRARDEKKLFGAIERGPEIRPLTPGAARLLRSLQAQRKSSRPGDLDDPRKISFRLYKNRNIIERFFARLKQFRGIATRYDKLKSTFFAAAQLVSTIIRIN